MKTSTAGRFIALIAFTALFAAPVLRAGEDRPDAVRAELRALEEKAVALKADGRMEEATAVRREMEALKERMRNREREAAKPSREAGPDERVRHVREAMEQLHAAGFADLAERVGQECKRRLEEERARGGADTEQLRAEVQELRQQVRTLSERLEQAGQKP